MSAEATQSRTPIRAQRAKKRAAPTPLPSVSLANLDYPLIAIVATFLALGLFMVYSASAPRFGSSFFTLQLKWVVVGILAFIVVAAIPFRLWRLAPLPLMGVTVIGLVAVLVISNGQFGANRTLLNGRFQPSELAKLAVAIYVAAWAATQGRKLERFEEGLAPFLIIMGLVAGLIALERSFSVTLIVLTIGLAVYFVAGGNLRQVLGIVALAAPVLALLMWQAGYPFKRINAWLTMLFNPSAASPDQLRIFEMLRAGRGIGTDPAMWQAKAAVPGLWSDYLFANIGADLHFPGTLLVVGLYAWFGYRGLVIILSTRDRFAKLTAVGLTTWILVQAAIHIGTSLALIPVTGQPLPFMSYGGSSLVSCLVAAGLLLSISRESREKKGIDADFAFGWWDRRPRVSHSSRGGGVAKDDPLVRGAPHPRTGTGTRRNAQGRRAVPEARRPGPRATDRR